MNTEHTLALITELATWNGRLAAAIEIALIDFKYNDTDAGLQTLRRTFAEYETYRKQEYEKQTRPRSACCIYHEYGGDLERSCGGDHPSIREYDDVTQGE